MPTYRVVLKVTSTYEIDDIEATDEDDAKEEALSNFDVESSDVLSSDEPEFMEVDETDENPTQEEIEADREAQQEVIAARDKRFAEASPDLEIDGAEEESE
jgi:hypothetical protein